MELCPGPYTGQHWGQHSLFFHENTFGLFEPIISRHVSGYSDHGHWGMTEVPESTWQLIINDLNTFRSALPVMNFEAFSRQVVFAFQPMRSYCEQNFQQAKNETTAIITELAEWLIQQLKTHRSVTILGI